MTPKYQTNRSFNPVSKEARQLMQNYTDNQRYLKSREVPQDVSSEINKRANLHQGYKGYLQLLKGNQDDSDEDMEGNRSLVQEIDYQDKKKASK